MGNKVSGELVDLEQVMRELDALEASSVNKQVEKTPDGHVPYKIVVRIGEKGEDIIKNLRIYDSGYRSVVLTVGTQIFTGQHDAKTKMWDFPTAIPLFKIPEETCQLTIYSLGDECSGPIRITYDSYSQMPTDIKKRCNCHALVSGEVMYSGGIAF